MKKLTIKQLVEGRTKVFRNVADLIEEAGLLHKNKKYARSLFLSSIAIEELGKYLMIFGAIGETAKKKMDWNKFWKRFRSHIEKLADILTHDVFLGPFESDEKTIKKLQKVTQISKNIHNEKLDSLSYASKLRLEKSLTYPYNGYNSTP